MDAGGGRNRIIIDSREGPEYRNVHWPLVMSDDGAIVTTIAEAQGGWVLLINDRVLGPFPSVTYPRIGPDDRSVGVVVGGDTILVNGERTHVDGAEIDRFAIGWDGRVAAYAWSTWDEHDEEHVFIRHGSRTWGVPAAPSEMAVSRDGQLFYVLRSGDGQRAVLAVDGRAAAEQASISRLRFAPDGRPVYLVEEHDSRFLVVGERRYRMEGSLWRLRIAFSPDMKKVGYGTLIGRELWWKVIALE